MVLLSTVCCRSASLSNGTTSPDLDLAGHNSYYEALNGNGIYLVGRQTFTLL
jgi:hypothetical protein